MQFVCKILVIHETLCKLENYEEISGNSIAEDFTFKEMYYQSISALVLVIDSLKIYRNLKEV